jgi:ATP-dependent DNA ligase
MAFPTSPPLQSCHEQAQLYAFDMLAGDGDDHRRLPLSLRKANRARLPASFSPTTSNARSVTIYSAPPAA